MSDTPTTPKKVVFLDIDGVMTSINEGNSYLCLNPDLYGISDYCFNRLMDIVKRTGAKVVISSNWRRFPANGYLSYSGKRYWNQLPSLKERLGDVYFGDVPHDRRISKSAGIILWSEDYNVDLNDGSFDYVILDDCWYEMDDGTQEMLRRFIHCDERTGLTKDDVERAVKILNGG